MIVPRRNVLALAAGSLCAAGPSLGSVAPKSLDPADAATRLRNLMLMRGALDGRLVIGFSYVRYYGVSEGEVRPLYASFGGTFSRYRAIDGGYEGTSFEIPYYTDLSGKLIDRLHNPYTGETVAVPQEPRPTAHFRFSADLVFTLLKDAPGVSKQSNVPPDLRTGDDVWMVEESNVTLRPQSPGARGRYYSETITMRAAAADLARPDARQVGSITSIESVASWKTWMNMGDRPGLISGGGFGRYGMRLADMPPAWLEAARSRHPDVLADPGARLAALDG